MSNLQTLSYRRLVEQAKQLGIHNLKGMTKKDLIVAIEAKQTASNPLPSFDHELKYGPITSTTPEDQEQQRIVFEAYPMLLMRQHVVDTMPNLRDFKSDWAKKNTSWAPWKAVADDIDAVASSPDEKDRELLSMLLEYIDRPTNALLRRLLAFDVGQWADLYSALSYAILRDKQAVPLILKFVPFFMNDLLDIYEERVATVFTINYAPVVDDEDGEERPPKLTFDGEKELTDMVWGVDEILQSISSSKTAEWLVGVADAHGFDLEKIYAENVYIAQALFDNDHITRRIISTLCRVKDIGRLTSYIDNMKETKTAIVQTILLSKQPELTVHLIKKLYALYDNGFAKDLLEGEIHHVRVDSKTLTAIIDYLEETDRLADIQLTNEEDYDEILPPLIQENDLELLTLYERLGLPLVRDEMYVGDEIYSNSLNYVLRTGSHNLYERFYSLYSHQTDPVRLLYDLMEDLSRDTDFPLNVYGEHESPMGVEWLLEREAYTKKQLVTAIALSTNRYKTCMVLKKLGLEYDQDEVQ